VREVLKTVTKYKLNSIYILQEAYADLA